MTEEEFNNHPGWEFCTSQGARDQVLLLGLETSFQEKLEWLEEAEDLTIQFRESRMRNMDQRGTLQRVKPNE